MIGPNSRRSGLSPMNEASKEECIGQVGETTQKAPIWRDLGQDNGIRLSFGIEQLDELAVPNNSVPCVVAPIRAERQKR